jgi:hypothetical protein
MKRLIALTLALLLLLCCGCTPKGGEDVEATTPTPAPDVPATVETVVDKISGDAETVDVAVTIHGQEELIPMTPVSGSFAHEGGPKFTLLVDKSRYQVNDVGGYCYITLPTGMSGDVYVELGFRSEVKAEDIGTEILDEYGIMGVKVPAEQEWLGSNRVRHLHGKTVQNEFDVYLLDTEGGCMTVVLSTSPYTTAHRARLMATMESLEIFE